MTNNQLERSLIEEIEALSSDIHLEGIDGQEKRLKGYAEAIPQLPLPTNWNEETGDGFGESDPEDALIPYFIVKTTEISYQEGEGVAKLYLLFCICDHSQEMQGYQTLWNLLNRITGRFRADTILDAFYCEKRMKAVIQDEDTYPYFFGGIEMEWNLPEMEEDEVI